MTMDESRIPLEALDPEREDPGYWARLQRRIVSAAALELARRRRMDQLTVSGVLSSWSRTVVPAALMAAALATLLLLREAPPTLSAPGATEGVVAELDADGDAILLPGDGSPESGVTFASLEEF